MSNDRPRARRTGGQPSIDTVMFMFLGLSYAELGVMFPVSGGVVRFPQYAFGSLAGYTLGWVAWLGVAVGTSIEVLAAVQYATPYLPWLMHSSEGVQVLTSLGTGVAVGMMFLFSLINVLGVKLFARFNNVLVWWKLGVIVLAVTAFFFAADFHGGNFVNHGGFAPYGVDAVFSALATAGVAFSFFGFRQGVEFAGETDDPQRNVPFAVIGSIIATSIIYIGLQLAFIGVLPESTFTDWASLSFANDAGPLAGAALLVGLGWLAVLLYIDAVVSPADTGLIYAALTTRLSYANARNGNAPQWLAKLNQRGIPWPSVILMFVVGCLALVPFPSWQKLVGFVTTAIVLSLGTGPVAVGALRRQLPDQERPFRVPGGDTIPFLAFLSTNLIVFWAGWNTNWKMGIGVLLGYVVLAAHSSVARSQMPNMEWRSGSWVLLWFGGIGVISWIGSYGGGIGILTDPWAILTITAWSAIVYVYAVAFRLPPRRVVKNIQHTPANG